MAKLSYCGYKEVNFRNNKKNNSEFRETYMLIEAMVLSIAKQRGSSCISLWKICCVFVIHFGWPLHWTTKFHQRQDHITEHWCWVLPYLMAVCYGWRDYSLVLSCNKFDCLQDSSQNAGLVGSTLDTLLRFLNWIPLGYIFETKLIPTLIYKV